MKGVVRTMGLVRLVQSAVAKAQHDCALCWLLVAQDRDLVECPTLAIRRVDTLVCSRAALVRIDDE